MSGSGIGQFAKINQTTDILIFLDAVNAHNQSFPQQNLDQEIALYFWVEGGLIKDQTFYDIFLHPSLI